MIVIAELSRATASPNEQTETDDEDADAADLPARDPAQEARDALIADVRQWLGGLKTLGVTAVICVVTAILGGSLIAVLTIAILGSAYAIIATLNAIAMTLVRRLLALSQHFSAR